MKFESKSVAGRKIILANEHYVSVPVDCTNLTSLATDGVIPAGTVIPANDDTAKGVLYNDVVIAENPNGALIIHGFIKSSSLPTAPSADAKTALHNITFE